MSLKKQNKNACTKQKNLLIEIAVTNAFQFCYQQGFTFWNFTQRNKINTLFIHLLIYIWCHGHPFISL